MVKPRRPHRVGRKRRVAGGLLISLGIVLAGAWVWSGWWATDGCIWGFYLFHGRGEFYALAPTEARAAWMHRRIEREANGQRHTWWLGLGPESTYPFDRHFHLGICSFRHIERERSRWTVRAAYWPAPLVSWGAGGWHAYRGVIARRRALSHRCPACGYSLVGLAADAVCPECGATSPAVGPGRGNDGRFAEPGVSTRSSRDP